MIEVLCPTHTLRPKIVPQQQPAAPLLCPSKVFVRCVILTLCPPIVSRRVSNQSFLPSLCSLNWNRTEARSSQPLYLEAWRRFVASTIVACSRCVTILGPQFNIFLWIPLETGQTFKTMPSVVMNTWHLEWTPWTQAKCSTIWKMNPSPQLSDYICSCVICQKRNLAAAK